MILTVSHLTTKLPPYSGIKICIFIYFILFIILLFYVQLEDCALQLYRHNGTQYEYSSYLDLETTLAEQSEELDGFSDKYAHSLGTVTQYEHWPEMTVVHGFILCFVILFSAGLYIPV